MLNAQVIFERRAITRVLTHRIVLIWCIGIEIVAHWIDLASQMIRTDVSSIFYLWFMGQFQAYFITSLYLMLLSKRHCVSNAVSTESVYVILRMRHAYRQEEIGDFVLRNSHQKLCPFTPTLQEVFSIFFNLGYIQWRVWTITKKLLNTPSKSSKIFNYKSVKLSTFYRIGNLLHFSFLFIR